MKISINRRDTMWNLLGIIMSMCTNLIILPFVLRFLDDNSVGLYYVFMSLSSLTALFDLGFTASVSRSMTYAWSGASVLKSFGGDAEHGDQPNYFLMKRLIRACKRIYMLLSSAALVLSLTIGIVYINQISTEIDWHIAIGSWVIYAAGIFLNLLYGYYAVFLRGVGAISNVNKAAVFSRLLQIILCIVLLFCGLGLVGVSVAYVCYGFIYRFLAKIYFYKFKGIGDELKNIKIRKDEYQTKELLKIIWPNTWRDGLVTLSDFCLNQATTIISSLYLSLYETGLYSLCVQLASAIAQVASVMLTAYQPSMQSAYASKDNDTMKKNVSLITTSYVTLFASGMAGVIIVGRPLIAIVKPSYEFSIPLMLVVGCYQFLLKYRNNYCVYFSSTNRIIYSKSFVLSAIVCIGLSLVSTGVFRLGAYGLAFSCIISQIVYNAWHWSILAHKELEMAPKDVIKIGFTEIKKMILRQ